jgi:hypothetical protein
MPVVFRTIHGTHQIIVIGDDRPGTPEILEQRVESWDQSIATWKPLTQWDAANQRSLRWLQKRRAKARRAAERLANTRKELAIQERRDQRLRQRELERQAEVGPVPREGGAAVVENPV